MSSSSVPRPPLPRSKFPSLYWLAVLFEFFERGSYYGVMSVLSLYLTDDLGFSKLDVGVIKGTIQPLLYFLPIIAGALADRFGFRRSLLIAFGLLGGGYFLASRATGYAPMFLSLVVMGLGAGTFKPLISGTIARCTDETNSTLGFGIFYWSINLGAFVVPLFLVPWLKRSGGGSWVLCAAAIGTGAMLLPTLLRYREPPAARAAPAAPARRPGLLQTLADAFEIIYSPLVLLYGLARRSLAGVVFLAVLLPLLLLGGGWLFASAAAPQLTLAAPTTGLASGETLVVRAKRNLGKRVPYSISSDAAERRTTVLLHDPDRLAAHLAPLLAALRRTPGLAAVDGALLRRARDGLEQKTTLTLTLAARLDRPWALAPVGERALCLTLRERAAAAGASGRRLLDELRRQPGLAGLTATELEDLAVRGQQRPFLLLFLGLLFATALLVLLLEPRFKRAGVGGQTVLALGTLGALLAVIWLLPHLTLFARLLTSVIGATVIALYAIDYREPARFRDHFRFLSMIFIYAGFWVLYFQMFDSVLWYVQAYVDATGLDRAVNALLAALGLKPSFRFDVEHVTVINAGTIILLQLVISALVKNTRALPTMIVGILCGTVGMGILALSTDIWVFMLGTAIFSIGEMTAHPKFIAYVGQTAPRARVAMYMGYLFLYGVIGSSIGGVVGANLYVTFVDELNRPRTLWLIFTAIGAATALGLLLYNRFVVPRDAAVS